MSILTEYSEITKKVSTRLMDLIAMLGGSLVATVWGILRLRMERQPPDMEGNCEYNE
jgi:hypothetical protein